MMRVGKRDEMEKVEPQIDIKKTVEQILRQNEMILQQNMMMIKAIHTTVFIVPAGFKNNLDPSGDEIKKQ